MNTRPSILFVDDEERVVDQLRRIFRQQYDVHTATSGDEALKILNSTPIDVLVSDQRMPGMVGIELLATARKQWPMTIRMLLTGYSDLAAIVGSVNEGEVFRFVNKPWDHQEIQSLMAEAVAAGQAARASAEMSASGAGDAVAQATAAAAGEHPRVMLIDDNQVDVQAMAQVLSLDDQDCLTAGSIQEALDMLARNDVGVIVSEARVGRSDMGSFLHLLKQQHPMITTVMLTRSSDADLVIRLINKAQIFRFATKPLRKSVLQLAVRAAMKEHLNFRSNPHQVARHRVAKDEAAHQDSSLVASMMQSLAGLRNRFTLVRRNRLAV